MSIVGVVDYGASNLRSVTKALAHVGAARIVVSSDPDTLRAVDRIVFPGQGAVGTCMRALAERGLAACLAELIASKPFLGICLGLQCLVDYSAEDGGTTGLGIFPGAVRRFEREQLTGDDGRIGKIPHMGWNEVRLTRDHPLFDGIAPSSRFYFVHSYYLGADNPELALGTTRYGVEFCSVLARGNVLATQFHPEKSQRAGLTLLRNFLLWDGRV